MTDVLFDEIEMLLAGDWDAAWDDARVPAGGDAERYVITDETGGNNGNSYC